MKTTSCELTLPAVAAAVAAAAVVVAAACTTRTIR